MFVCLETHIVLHGGVPPGIRACLAGECLQARAGVNGLTEGEADLQVIL